MLCVSIPGPVSVACFSHVPLPVSIKCNKWECLQTAATGWNELNVLECPCHKRASTSWARSDRWVFFLMLILLNTTPASEMTEQTSQNAIDYYHILLGSSDVGDYMGPKVVKLIWVCGLTWNLEIPYLSTSQNELKGKDKTRPALLSQRAVVSTNFYYNNS